MPGPKSGVHGLACLAREGTEVRRSCATVPSAFPSDIDFDVGPYDYSAELDSQVRFLKVKMLLSDVDYSNVILRPFPVSLLRNRRSSKSGTLL